MGCWNALYHFLIIGRELILVLYGKVCFMNHWMLLGVLTACDIGIFRIRSLSNHWKEWFSIFFKGKKWFIGSKLTVSRVLHPIEPGNYRCSHPTWCSCCQSWFHIWIMVQWFGIVETLKQPLIFNMLLRGREPEKCYACHSKLKATSHW